MPAKSKSQQRLFGMVHAYQKGKLKNAPEKVKNVAEHISDDDAEHFARTSHKKLPEKKAYERGFMDKCAEYGVDPGTLVKIAKSIFEYLFDVSPDSESGNGLATRSKNHDYNDIPIQKDYKGTRYYPRNDVDVPTIQRLRQADGSVRYRVTRHIPTPNKDTVHRTISEAFSVVVDSPYKAMRLAKGNISFDPVTKKMLDELQRSDNGALISDSKLSALRKRLEGVSDVDLKQFKPPKQFGLHVTKPGVSSTVKKVHRIDVQEQAPSIIKRVLKLSPRNKALAAGGLASFPIAAIALYALNKRRKKREA